MDKQTLDELLAEYDREMKVTRTVLDQVPDEHLDWAPHPKSMKLRNLANHVATMTDWLLVTVDKDELDFADPTPPPTYANRAEMLAGFDRVAAQTRTAIMKLPLEKWHATWTCRQGPQVLHAASRLHIYRIWCLNHLVSHRGQLNLYYRLLNLPVATLYFNSADEPEFSFS